MAASNAQPESPSQLIDAHIADLADWRGEMLQRVRSLIREAEPAIVEEVKWRKPSNPLGVPVWSHDGIICTGETYRDKVKITFANGASLADPAGLFNSSLNGNTRRAIDLKEGDALDEAAFQSLVRDAAALNASKVKGKKTATKGKSSIVAKDQDAANTGEVKLLSGGNPQIPKGDGDAPVQAYIAAMPGWKSNVGRQLDELIVRTVPNVQKGVRWNSPFYGVEGQGWFVSYHCFTKYIKVTFFKGASLDPVPPVGSKDPETRYYHIYEGEELDKELLAGWMKQASQMPGWIP